jgi:hypothetical protein
LQAKIALTYVKLFGLGMASCRARSYHLPEPAFFHMGKVHGEQKEADGSKIKTQQDALEASQKDSRTRGIAQEERGNQKAPHKKRSSPERISAT